MNLNSYKVLLEKRTESLKEKLSRRYCPNRKSLSEQEVAELQNEIDFNEGLVKEISTIEYSRKVKIPKFVADWIIHVRSLNWNIQDLLNPSSSKYRTANLVYEWLRENEENTSTLCRAWLDNDYDVEEDPKYWVKLNDGYLSFVTFSYKAASEIETSADCREAILFTFKPQADHMALLVNGIAEEVNHGEKS